MVNKDYRSLHVRKKKIKSGVQIKETHENQSTDHQNGGEAESMLKTQIEGTDHLATAMPDQTQKRGTYQEIHEKPRYRSRSHA